MLHVNFNAPSLNQAPSASGLLGGPLSRISLILILHTPMPHTTTYKEQVTPHGPRLLLQGSALIKITNTKEIHANQGKTTRTTEERCSEHIAERRKTPAELSRLLQNGWEVPVLKSVWNGKKVVTGVVCGVPLDAGGSCCMGAGLHMMLLSHAVGS